MHLRHQRDHKLPLRAALAGIRASSAIALLAAFLVAAGCGGNGLPGGSEKDGFVGLLAQIPDNSQTRELIYLNDYARARDVFGIPLPGDDADEETLTEYLIAVNRGPEGSTEEAKHTGLAPGPWISGFSEHGAIQLKNRHELGFDVRNVHQSIMAGAPPQLLEVVKGRFNPREIERSIEGCSDCPKADRVEYEGVESYSWGEDGVVSLSERFSPPAFDQLGRGGRIAVSDSLVFRTVETPGMEALIRTHRGKGDSLADDEDLALAAGRLDDLEVFSALIIGDPEYFSAEDVLENLCLNLYSDECDLIRDRAASVGSLTEYEVLGAGAGKDGHGLFNAVILVYRDEGDAERNARQFEERLEEGSSLFANRRWSELIPDADVRAEGRTVLAKLRPQSAALWHQSVVVRDSLYMYE